jgi:hypothetical protein
MTFRWLTAIPVLALICVGPTASAETPDEWVKLLSRVHGGFGSFLPVGIRIGEDACAGSPSQGDIQRNRLPH